MVPATATRADSRNAGASRRSRGIILGRSEIDVTSLPPPLRASRADQGQASFRFLRLANIPTRVFLKPRIPHVRDGRSYHRLSVGTTHVTHEGRAPSRIDRDALHRPRFRGGRQSVGTDDRSASSSGSMTRPTSESPTPTSTSTSTPTPRVSLTERRRAERSNGEIGSRRTSHKSSISCYRGDTAQIQQRTLSFIRITLPASCISLAPFATLCSACRFTCRPLYSSYDTSARKIIVVPCRRTIRGIFVSW